MSAEENSPLGQRGDFEFFYFTPKGIVVGSLLEVRYFGLLNTGVKEGNQEDRLWFAFITLRKA
jgi:hypothetical protein